MDRKVSIMWTNRTFGEDTKGGVLELKFLCSRTSLWWPERPCDEAKPWLNKEGQPVVDDDGEIMTWYVEIDTLEELMAFIEKHENRVIIVAKCYYNEGLPGIEIYDDYRE